MYPYCCASSELALVLHRSPYNTHVAIDCYNNAFLFFLFSPFFIYLPCMYSSLSFCNAIDIPPLLDDRREKYDLREGLKRRSRGSADSGRTRRARIPRQLQAANKFALAALAG